VPYGSPCTFATQTRTCDNGGWSPNYPSCTYLSCSVGPPASCAAATVVWSQAQVAWHGNTATAGGYACSATVTAASHGGTQSKSPAESTRTGTATATCDNGTWTASGSCDGSLFTTIIPVTCTSGDPLEAKWVSWYAADFKRCADTEGLAYWIGRDLDTGVACSAYPTVGSAERDTCMRDTLRATGGGEYTYAQAHGHVSSTIEANFCGAAGAYPWNSWGSQCKSKP